MLPEFTVEDQKRQGLTKWDQRPSILRFKVASPTDNGPSIPSPSVLVSVMGDSVVYWEVKGPVSTWEVIEICDLHNPWECFSLWERSF